MVQLQDLPMELLSQCLSFIQWPDPDQARCNLMNISLVSRTFRDLAQPLLFRELEDFGLDGNMGRFILFLKAVIVRPQLGKYVHDVALHPAETDTLEEFVKDLPSQDIDLFRRALQEEALVSDMNVGVSSLLLALLLTKTPNLRVLYLCGTAFSLRPLNPIFARDPSFLSNLEEFHIKGDEGSPNYNIATFHGLLTRPHLKFVNATYGQLLGNNILTPWAPNPLAVEEFSLRQCHVNYNSLKQLIQACKKLTHFTFANWRADPDLLDDRGRRLTPDFDEVDLLEALLPHQDTLEHLDIEFLEGRDPARVLPFAKLPGGKMPSLRNFTVLDHLTIQLGLLPAHPEFPSALGSGCSLGNVTGLSGILLPVSPRTAKTGDIQSWRK